MTAHARSRGALALARVGATQEAIAARVKMERSLVAKYQNGSRIPPTVARATFEHTFGIDPALWDQPAEAPPVADPIAPVPWTLMSRVERLQGIVDRTLDRLSTDGNATPGELTRVARQLGQAMNEIGKLTGETAEVDEKKLLRLPAWRRIQGAIVLALKPWPEAMRAVAESLEELER